MAASSLLVLLDDIAAVLDDVAVMTKTSAQKVTGVLGDDLALNAQQASGVRADREIPVVLGVARGSLVNKMILVPAALLISALAPWLITPLMLLGGIYLCLEGAEKILHAGKKETGPAEPVLSTHASAAELAAFEAAKIKGAVRTDFVLSAEVVVLTLGIVATMPLLVQVIVLSIISLVMTIGVYGLVAGIVKIDDLGLLLMKRSNRGIQRLGRALVASTPHLMKGLSIVGTAAMFLVGGGILVHNIEILHAAEAWVRQLPAGDWLALAVKPGFGVMAGLLSIPMVSGASKAVAAISGFGSSR